MTNTPTNAERIISLFSHSERCHGEFPEPTVQDPITGKWNCSDEKVSRGGKEYSSTRSRGQSRT